MLLSAPFGLRKLIFNQTFKNFGSASNILLMKWSYIKARRFLYISLLKSHNTFLRMSYLSVHKHEILIGSPSENGSPIHTLTTVLLVGYSIIEQMNLRDEISAQAETLKMNIMNLNITSKFIKLKP